VAKRVVSKAAVLKAPVTEGSITAACRLAGVSKQRVYEWHEADPAFKQAVLDAQEECVDLP
jgi:molybdenum-dependent DNA-binding transcriptional regulator ModE